jgi:hypothetical protein
MLLQYSLGSPPMQFMPWWTHWKRTNMVMKDFKEVSLVAIKLIIQRNKRELYTASPFNVAITYCSRHFSCDTVPIFE